MSQMPYEGATAEQLQSHLVRQFLAVHDMFRNELAAMLGFVDELLDGHQQLTGAEAQARVHALIRTGMQYTQYLHSHHHHESSDLFPVLAQEDPTFAAIIPRLEAEHDQIGALVDQFSAGIRGLAAIDPRVLDTDMRRLSDALRAHLAYEETHVCPLLTHFAQWPM